MASSSGGETEILEVEGHDLQSFTNDFSAENFICHAQYCYLYHGKIPQGWKGLEGRDVTVKIWVKRAINSDKCTTCFYYCQLVDNFNFETGFLKSGKATSSRHLPRLIAHCRDDGNEFLGVVYDLKSSQTLRNFVEEAEFKWLERIKVGVGLARLLRFLLCDEPRYLVRDLSAAHIMLDKDWNPVLFNFFMLAAGAMDQGYEARSERLWYGSYGYIDSFYVMTGLPREYSDVFAFGVILCELLFKCKVDQKQDARGWYMYIYGDALKLYPLKKSKFSFKRKEYSLVDKSLEEDPGFNGLDGLKISKLARLCVDPEPETRPDIRKVVKWLEELHVVRDHVQIFTA